MSQGSSKPSFNPVAIKEPTLAEISELYRKAVADGDSVMTQVAHQAVARLGAAEAAMAEAATMVGFATQTKA